MRTVVRIVGTVLAAVLLCHPFWAPQWGTGLLGEIGALGMPGAPIAVAAFLGLVALYCRSLQRTMTLVRPEARTASPASVWWMFAIPCNFTEDFFIVRAVSTSMAASTDVAARVPGGFVRWWAVLGYGWCAFQILSLLPGAAGYAGGAIALPLWAAHWIMTGHVNRRLAARRPVAPLAESL